MSAPDQPPNLANLLPITEVERQTGIRQATLRMWEKRYGFPQPLRDRHGDRVYPPNQVERLHAVRRLMDQGIRPGKIFSGAVALDTTIAVHTAPDGVQAPYRRILGLLREYRVPELHALFEHGLMDLGLRRFVIEFLAPLSTEVGLAWNRGELPVRSEHLYAQLASAILHARQPVRAAGESRPKVLLATLTGESHALGILMVEAVLASLEADCIQLGADTPPLEVAAAAHEIGADIVALSFSSYFPRKSASRMLMALREALPPATAVWAGGEGAGGVRAQVTGVDVFDSLEAIAPALSGWRSLHSCLSAPPFHARWN